MEVGVSMRALYAYKCQSTLRPPFLRHTCDHSALWKRPSSMGWRALWRSIVSFAIFTWLSCPMILRLCKLNSKGGDLHGSYDSISRD